MTTLGFAPPASVRLDSERLRHLRRAARRQLLTIVFLVGCVVLAIGAMWHGNTDRALLWLIAAGVYGKRGDS